ncbi:hypothetical protein [Geodermatophilus arenarius]|uniref:DivIVA protein n=1 Tax=Geodermatophilus arenarius TaxID=1137990 RepID=A0ABV9LR54_9ACTN
MTTELQVDEELRPTGPERRRPNVSGDLPTVLEAGPMFGRAVAGYDRFQVDTYVQWAEDQLATADREREHLVTRLLSTRAALDEARALLGHSSGGGEFLQVSRRIGSVLAAAADEAEGMRAEAEAAWAAASEQAERVVARAQRTLADAEAEADRTAAAAAAYEAECAARAAQLLDEAERSAAATRAAAAARLDDVRAAERRAAAAADRVRQRAEEDAAAAAVRARAGVVAMLATGREERRRADAEAAATRERLDREAVARRAALLAELAELGRQRSALRAELDLLARPAPVPPPDRWDVLRQWAGLLRGVRDRAS